MDARPLRRMTFGHRVITGGSHAPTPSYPQPRPGPPPRRRAPPGRPEVQGLQEEDLGPGPLVAVARRRRTDHLAVRRLRATRRRPLRRDRAQGAPGHAARLRRAAAPAQCRAGRAPARGPAHAAPAAGHRPDPAPLPRPTAPRPPPPARPSGALDEISRGQAKDGPSHFHASATAYVVRHGQRYTVALTG